MKYKAVNTVWDKKQDSWVCPYCKSETDTIYVITGHDHTDSYINVCNCGQGTSIEVEWNKNRYARDYCPDQFKD